MEFIVYDIERKNAEDYLLHISGNGSYAKPDISNHIIINKTVYEVKNVVIDYDEYKYIIYVKKMFDKI